MKYFILSLILIGFTVSASELSAPQALLSLIPPGHYSGLTPKGKACLVKIQLQNNEVTISANDDHNSRESTIKSNALYRWNVANRSFLSTVKRNFEHYSLENIFRTLAVTENTQYIVVADIFTKGRKREEVSVECIIH